MSQAIPGGDQSNTFVSLIVPAYNEARTLYSNLETLHAHLQELPFEWELLVIDDGSSDDTGAEAIRFADGHDGVRLISHSANFGLGQALRTGFHNAQGDILVTFDSDLSYAPEHIDRLVQTMQTTGASLVVASPYMEGGSVTGVPRMRAVMSRYANWMLRRLSLHHISTVTGMVRAYRRDFIDNISLKSVDNQINAEIIYKATLLRRLVIEIPGHLVWTRNEEETKERSGKLRYVTMIIDSIFSGFIFRPFSFFIVPGFILFVLAAYSLGWAFWHFLTFLPDQSGSLDAVISGAAADAFALSPHSVVIGGISMVLAVQLFSIGIISAQSKRYFEELWFQGAWLADAERSGERAARLDGESIRRDG